MTKAFVNFDVVYINNFSHYAVQLSPPLLFGLDKAYLLKPGKIVDTYFELMVNISEALGANKSDAQKQLKDSLYFEIQIAQISSLSSNPDQTTHMSINDLQQQYGYVSWLEFINNLLPENVTLKSTDTVYVQEREYFFKLKNLLDKTDKRVQANYAIWRAILEKINYFPEDTLTLYSQASDIIDNASQEKNKNIRCTLECYQSLPDVLNAMYLRHFGKNNIDKVNEIIRYLKSSFGEIISDVEWMDYATKIKALEKLREMQISVNHDNSELLEKYYKNLELDPTDYFNNSLKVYILRTDNRYRNLLSNKKKWIEEDEVKASASYYPPGNRIFISAAILHPPFFSESVPMYINFGSLGVIIGHEIIHGFDDIGSRYDKHGDLNSWWSELTTSLYENQTQCLINQYSSYKLLNISINGTSTLIENIADNGGIKLAFSAYYNWLKDHEEETTGNLKYSARQMFWIVAARNWCGFYRNEYLKDLITVCNKYPPSKFRVKGPFSNSEEFAVAFNCPKGSNMNPREKCLMWQDTHYDLSIIQDILR
ncbi:hypothetical protein ILUMI_01198 [Ignelater luminosus]|uniref:Uncharacterized protein n=1 Tax=Ignelater luminosus TaxID=2038154 RepID=A0A8K0DIU2_IGNLU|nr:hypothetical protein ILUMI_01198 [Ignelater luminosus]